jgi:SAM-dependent methyltransferase
MPVGSELAPYADYLFDRAATELSVSGSMGGRRQQQLASLFIRTFGVPEIGVQLRIQRIVPLVPSQAKRIVDVGCGAGMFIGALRRARPDTEITGIEIDSKSVDLARRAHAYANVIAGDAQSVSRDYQKQFDCAVCIDVLEHVPDEELSPFISALQSMLRSGGTAIVHVPLEGQRRHLSTFADWGHHDHEREGFQPESLAASFESHGFRVQRLIPTFGWGASLAWELNMLVAAHPVQALAFPLLMPFALAAERMPSKRHNGVIVVAQT